MTAPRLSGRLARLADLSGGYALADIGTDHAYLPIYLVMTGKIQRAFAMDIGEGPLARARENVRAYGLGDYITLRRSDGLAALQEGEAGTIVIAGMGGDLTLKILREGERVASSAKELILQPQSNIHKVREYIYRKGYAIDREELVLEDGKFYPMFHVPLERKEGKKPSCSGMAWNMACRYGEPGLVLDRDLQRRYLLHKISRFLEIEKSLCAKADGEGSRIRRQEISEELSYAKAALVYFGGM